MDLPGDPNRELLKGRYQIEKVLGQGGMGTVYLSSDLNTNSSVAIKSLNTSNLSTNPELLQRFRLEGEILHELNHPNIVKILGDFEHGGTHHLVMEYVEGGDLTRLLELDDPIELPRILSIALELADALTRAHHLNILHRDIKPANVLLADDGSVRLTDFGIAYLAGQERITKEATLMGTVEYLSPDVCLGLELDARADLWSFGVLLYELLLGQVPFVGENPVAVITAILHQEIPDMQALRPEIPDGVADLLYRMLVKDRDGRIPSARLVGAELEGLLHGFEITPSQAQGALAPDVRIDESQFTTTSPPSTEIKINLPPQSTRFIGRASELSELDRLLAQPETRLLTILGLGGMGKTRLGIEAARAQAHLFNDGVYFIDLAPLSEPDHIPRAMSESLDFTFGTQGSPEEQAINFLRDKKLLLLIDNFEHLVAGAPFLTDMLAQSPAIKILVTSRTRLNLQGEHVFELHGMHTPEGDSSQDFEEVEAVDLFITSARRVRPDYELTEEDKAAVGQICRAVEGMPLGIQLAAAWVNVLEPIDILEELNTDIDFLESKFQDTPDRQRSIRAAFNYSWRQLSGEQKEVFKRLSMFRGGFSREAARQVAGAGVRTLSELVERSLLQRTSLGRFYIHELMRQFAEEELSKDPAQDIETHALHLEYYAEFLAIQGPKLIGDMMQLRDGLKATQTELDNCLAAWNWGLTHKKLQALRQAEKGLFRFLSWANLYILGHSTAKKSVAALEKLEPGLEERQQRILYWRLLTWQVNWFGYLANLEHRIDWVEKMEQILETAITENAVAELGQAFLRLLDNTSPSYFRSRGLEAFDLAQHVFESSGQLFELSEILENKARYYLNILGDAEKAVQLFEESLEIALKINSAVRQGFIYQGLGTLRRHLGEYEQAARYLRMALSIARESLEFGNVVWVIVIQRRLAVTLLYLGEYDHARELLEEASDMLGEKRYRNYQLGVERRLADIHILTGNYEEARHLLDEYCEYFLNTPGYLGLGRYSQGKLANFQGDYAQAEAHLEKSLTLFEKGHEHPGSGDAAMVYSLLGEVYRASGQRSMAWDTLGKAIKLCLKRARIGDLMAACLGLAYWLKDAERFEEAVEVAGMVETTQGTIRYDLERTGELLADLQDQVSPEVYSAAQLRGELLTPQSVYQKYWG